MTDKLDELKEQFGKMEEKLKDAIKDIEVNEWRFQVAKVDGDIFIDASVQVKIPKKK
jgi:hypothetical protein